MEIVRRARVRKNIWDIGEERELRFEYDYSFQNYLGKDGYKLEINTIFDTETNKRIEIVYINDDDMIEVFKEIDRRNRSGV